MRDLESMPSAECVAPKHPKCTLAGANNKLHSNATYQVAPLKVLPKQEGPKETQMCIGNNVELSPNQAPRNLVSWQHIHPSLMVSELPCFQQRNLVNLKFPFELSSINFEPFIIP